MMEHAIAGIACASGSQDMHMEQICRESLFYVLK